MALQDGLNFLRIIYNFRLPNQSPSLEDFMDAMAETRSRVVFAYPHIRADSRRWESFHRDRLPENYGRWEHFTIYHAFGPPRSPDLTLREYYGIWGQHGEYEDPSAARRDLAQLKHYATIQDRFRKIRSRLPGVEAEIRGPLSKMDDLSYRRLEELAETENLRPFSPTYR